MVRNSKILGRLQRYSVFRSLALGIVLGLGIGAGPLLDIGGLIGRGVCLVVLGTAFWFAWDAEPVLVGTDVEPELKPEPAPDELPPEPPVEADRASHGTLLSIAQFWAPCQRVLPPRLPLPNPPDPMRPLPRGGVPKWLVNLKSILEIPQACTTWPRAWWPLFFVDRLTLRE